MDPGPSFLPFRKSDLCGWEFCLLGQAQKMRKGISEQEQPRRCFRRCVHLLGIKKGREPCAGPPCTRRGADGDVSPAPSSGPSQHTPSPNRARNSGSHPQTAAMAVARSEDEPSAAGSQQGSAKQTEPRRDGAADALLRGGHRWLHGPHRGTGRCYSPAHGAAMGTFPNLKA